MTTVPITPHHAIPAAAGPAETISLAQTEARDPTLVGGKAAGLARALHAGLPVPPGFVITTAAARAFVSAAGLGAAASPDEVAAAQLPRGVVAAVRAALAMLGDGPVAVRSSAVGEDAAEASFAGQYESVLDVRGADAVLAAVLRVWASAHAQRARSYGAAAGCEQMAVLVQRMVPAEAAGVAFTADPITGARDVTVLSAVSGLGDRLVSGEASAEEWEIQGERARRTRDAGVLDATTARAVARLAARCASEAGSPQDVEWALCDGALSLLQTRPMTALPDEVRWDAPPWGGWARNFRLGEWIGDPVTPSFESWLLTDVEDAMHARFAEVSGWPMPRPAHVVVHGWYFYGLNVVGEGAGSVWRVLARIPVMLWKLVTRFRDVAGLTPPLAHLGFDAGVRAWRTELLPAYEAQVAEATRAVPDATPAELARWIDRLAATIGRNFASVAAVGGYAAKTELPLLLFWSKHLAHLEGSWLSLVRSGRAAPTADHEVVGLDWFHPTSGELGLAGHAPRAEVSERVAADRDAVLAAARAALPSRRLVSKLDALVAEARRAHAVREEQTRAMTLAWPVLRDALHRLGAHLVERGILAETGQVFFLHKDEILAGLDGTTTSLAARASDRRATWERQRLLAPPLVLGTLGPPFDKVFAAIEGALHGEARPGEREIFGHPGSPGRATGRACVIRSPDELGRLRPGDVLVAPVTTPAWTPAFARAVAVITDSGSIASHASIVAREYGLPAVVATGDATRRLRDGQTVTVDGHRGVVRVE